VRREPVQDQLTADKHGRAYETLRNTRKTGAIKPPNDTNGQIRAVAPRHFDGAKNAHDSAKAAEPKFSHR
jgi:hypothetical protein